MDKKAILKTQFSWEKAFSSDPKLEPTTKHVLCVIRMFMSQIGDSCFPSIERIQYMSGLSNAAVRKHLKIAIEKGWLIKGQHGFSGQRWKTNEYRAAVPEYYFEHLEAVEAAGGEYKYIRAAYGRKPKKGAPQGSVASEKGTPQGSAPSKAEGTPQGSAPLNEGTPSGSAPSESEGTPRRSTKGTPPGSDEYTTREHTTKVSKDTCVKPASPPSHDGEGNGPAELDVKKLYPTLSRLPKSDGGRYVYPAPFEKFIDAYPRTANKTDAYKAWRAAVVNNQNLLNAEGATAGLTDAGVLIYAAERYAEQVKAEKTETRYMKHAATFLGGAYLEYLPSEKKPQAEGDESETDFSHLYFSDEDAQPNGNGGLKAETTSME